MRPSRLQRMPRGAPPKRQRGVVLAIAMIFMLVLTLLGVTAISTTALEERMAGNLQASTQAFQAAETGVARVINSAEFATGDSCASSSDYVSRGAVGSTASSTTCQDFLQTTVPTRSEEGWGQETVSFNHFGIESEGVTQSNARTSVTQGIRLLGPAQGSGVLIETGSD